MFICVIPEGWMTFTDAVPPVKWVTEVRVVSHVPFLCSAVSDGVLQLSLKPTDPPGTEEVPFKTHPKRISGLFPQTR